MIHEDVEEKEIEKQTIAEITRTYIPWTWEKVFKEAEPELAKISSLLEEEEKRGYKIYPLKKHMFKAFHLTPLHKVRVVIIGQDPYPQSIEDSHSSKNPRAQGLSFSVSRADVIPASLKTVYQELKREYPDYQIPVHGDLTEWAAQGVLLLNSCLSVRAEEPGSHKKIWLGFIERILKAISEKNAKFIILLWGKQAQDTIQPLLDGKCIQLTAGHPSTMNRNSKNITNPNSFLGCDHFRKVNDILKERGDPEIRWQLSIF